MRDIQAIKDKIVETMLPEVADKGWSLGVAESATARAGFQDMMCQAVFPEGLTDIVAHFSDLTDRRMTQSLAEIDPESLRVRERVKHAIMARFDYMDQAQARPAARAMLAYWAVPMRVFQGQRVLWRTADRIWVWAGDTSRDYNHYTKRSLLSSLIMGTTLVWLDDTSENHAVTRAFLDRRLENVMEIGRAIGTIRQTMPDLTKTPWTGRT